ncbi:transport and Golgi organization protein 2 [Thrips palmi]|uniref:Transport and Golgi organization protein 2 n=1 Tax=Thrips palmi TaxID=161013 RepID=A0A6P8YJK1_THRPL|nr:transport and Golgi organization protein 2 [Thrips palmi]XP_034237195.1 transport and Golgi organization protein 2 [Thrips palmi]XP_034237196.1 transport and Golgi organization protein 2 [Thrips palmi]
MCILFLELSACPAPDGYRLILASNRDEAYRRPTDHAHHWEEAPSVFGGRDQEPGREGGTWLALDTAGRGRLAVLLNVMGSPTQSDMRPRGSLVSDFVRGELHAKDYAEALAKDGLEYSAFHLVTIDLDEASGGLWHYSNCSPEEGVASEVTHFRSGRLSLGNSVVQEPFRKVAAGGERFDAILAERRADRDRLVEELVALLKWDHTHFPDERLASRAARSNLSLERLQQFSSIYQRHANYGTRTHTVILVDANWRCDYYEWTLGESREAVDPDKSRWNYIHKTFQLGPSA